MRTILTGLLVAAAYVLMAGTFSATELGTAAGIGALAMLWRHVQHSISDRNFVFSLRHVAVWIQAFAGMPLAAWRTGLALLSALFGHEADSWRAWEQAFRRGQRDDPVERARRATAVLAASLAPASFVVRAAPRRDMVLLHGINNFPPADAEWLA